MSKRLSKSPSYAAALASNYARLLADIMPRLQSARHGYAEQAAEHGGSRNVPAFQIEAYFHRRQNQVVTNFKTTLPPAQAVVQVGEIRRLPGYSAN
jgi:hypothetical protein